MRWKREREKERHTQLRYRDGKRYKRERESEKK